MISKHFQVKKYLGGGCLTDVFEVASTSGRDRGVTYALKRFQLENNCVVKRALREHRILKRITLEASRRIFLSTLYYSSFHHSSPVLLISKGSGVDLSKIRQYFNNLCLYSAKFYCTEIICGLSQLHKLGIAHLDIKPGNILLSDSGHVIITDFDCAFDLLHNPGSPTADDFNGTPSYMAPEIANRSMITLKADIWSLGATMAVLMSGSIRPHEKGLMEEVRGGDWRIKGFKKFPKELQSFFNACLAFQPEDRPDIEEIKYHQLFADVKWNVVASLGQSPPYLPAKINVQFPTSSTFSMSRNNAIFSSDDLCITIQESEATEYKQANLREKLLMKGLQADDLEKLIFTYSFVNEIGISRDDVDTN